jgi:hypothetical protein
MTQSTEMWVDRTDFRRTKTVQLDLPKLAAGQVLVAMDKFALTSNNVSYAVGGDFIGYWNYYPADEQWGKVPVWGCADVIESDCADVEVGERLWGFFPMASHAILQPGKIREEQFTDVAVHRQELPDLYNKYRRTQAEPEFIRNMETERCLLFPLFATSYLLADYLIDNDFFGAQQVFVGSVSSKTGFGLAQLLHSNPEVSQRVVGLTSAGNIDFVKRLNCCDDVVLYGEEETNIDASLPAAYVDMSGDGRLTKALHHHLGENLVESCMVGATHWENMAQAEALPGATPQFFFAPAQITKRDAEWGAGVVMGKAMMASAELAQAIKGDMSIHWTRGPEDLAVLWNKMLDNQVPPSEAQMVSLL